MNAGEQSWFGRWWLPGRDGEAVNGELVLTSDEFVLKLSGELAPNKPQPSSTKEFASFFRRIEEPLIFGETLDGEAVSLLECEGLAPELPAPLQNPRWFPDAALLGVHLESLGAATFTGLQAEFDHLLDWARASLDRPLTRDEKPGSSKRLSIDLETEVVATARSGGTTIQLRTFRRWSADHRKVEAELRPNFRVELDDPTEWRDVMRRYVRPLRDLISFATLRGARIDEVRLRPRDHQEGAWPRLVLRWIDLGRPPREGQDLLIQDMLFTAKTLPGGFEAGLRRWLELHESRSAVMDLIFGVDYAPFIYDEQRFLALAQAAEIFHRIAVGGSRLPTEEHQRRVEAAVSSLGDGKLQDWARPILQQANFLRLGERIEGLISPLGNLGIEIAGGDSGRFVRRIVDTRNFLTHQDERKPNVLEVPDRYWHGQALVWLIRAWLLEELGMPGGEVAQSLKRNSRFGEFVEEMRGIA